MSPRPSRQSSEPFYVVPADTAVDKIIAPPPAPGSAQYEADLQTLLDLQRMRSNAEIKDAQADAQLTVFRFADVLGPEFRAEKLPITTKFLRQIGTDVGRAAGLGKESFHRLRPYVSNPQIMPIIEKPGGDSYPSGHAAYGYVNGILLAMMVPEKAPELFARAVRYGRNRNIAGVHYPSDVEAGRTVASIVVALALRNPQFVADLAESKAELRGVLGLK